MMTAPAVYIVFGVILPFYLYRDFICAQRLERNGLASRPVRVAYACAFLASTAFSIFAAARWYGDVGGTMFCRLCGNPAAAAVLAVLSFVLVCILVLHPACGKLTPARQGAFWALSTLVWTFVSVAAANLADGDVYYGGIRFSGGGGLLASRSLRYDSGRELFELAAVRDMESAWLGTHSADVRLRIVPVSGNIAGMETDHAPSAVSGDSILFRFPRPVCTSETETGLGSKRVRMEIVFRAEYPYLRFWAAAALPERLMCRRPENVEAPPDADDSKTGWRRWIAEADRRPASAAAAASFAGGVAFWGLSALADRQKIKKRRDMSDVVRYCAWKFDTTFRRSFPPLRGVRIACRDAMRGTMKAEPKDERRFAVRADGKRETNVKNEE